MTTRFDELLLLTGLTNLAHPTGTLGRDGSGNLVIQGASALNQIAETGDLEWLDTQANVSVVAEGEDLDAAVTGSSSGDVVVVLPGTYALTATLSIPDGVSVVGLAGSQETVITSTASPAVQLNGDHRVQVIGLDYTPGAGTPSAFSEAGIGDVVLADVFVDNVGSNDCTGFDFSATAGGGRLQTHDCGVATSGTGGVVGLDVGQAWAARVYGWQFRDVPDVDDLLRFDTTADALVVGIDAELEVSSSFQGFLTTQGSGTVTVVGCRANQTGGLPADAFTCAGGTLRLHGCVVAGSWADDLTTGPSGDVTLRGCSGITLANSAINASSAIDTDAVSIEGYLTQQVGSDTALADTVLANMVQIANLPAGTYRYSALIKANCDPQDDLDVAMVASAIAAAGDHIYKGSESTTAEDDSNEITFATAGTDEMFVIEGVVTTNAVGSLTLQAALNADVSAIDGTVYAETTLIIHR